MALSVFLELERCGEGWREKWATSELDVPLADTGRMEKNKEEPQEIFGLRMLRFLAAPPSSP